MPYQAPETEWKLSLKQTNEYLSSKPEHEIELNQGDVLYIPGGVVHDAYTNDDTSIHVTIGMHPFLRTRILEELIDHIKLDSFFRELAYPITESFDIVESKDLFLERTMIGLKKFLEKSDFDFLKSNDCNKFKDTQNMFSSVVFVDDLSSVQDLGNFRVITLSANEQLEDGEIKLLNVLKEYEINKSNSSFDNFPIETLKPAFKSLIRKGYCVVTTEVNSVAH